MKKILIVILTWLLIFGSCLLCSAQEWHGIVLLKTTRKQVEKILESEAESRSNDQVQFYALEEETMLVEYSKGSCAESEENEWNVPKDTVISLSVHPREKTFLKSLSFDLSQFERIPRSAERYLQFRNLKDGIGISVDEDSGESLVRNIQYYPSKAMEGYKCR